MILLYKIPAKRASQWDDVPAQSSSHLAATGSLGSSDCTKSHTLSRRIAITFSRSFCSPQSPAQFLAQSSILITVEPMCWNGYFPKSVLYASWHDPLASVNSIITLRMVCMCLWSASTSPHWNGTEEGEKITFTENWYTHSEQVSTVVGEGASHCHAISVLSQSWQQQNQISTTFTLHWFL